MVKREEPPGLMSDADVIARSFADPDVFAAIFDRHYAPIRRYVGRRVDTALADELTSETFARAFAGRERYDAAHVDAGPWLYGIATNLLRKHHRSEDRRRRAYARLPGLGVGSGGLYGVAGRADAAALGPAVAAALGRLQPGDRDALLLLALTDLDYEGIAVAMGVPIGTVRSRLHRARRHIANDLAPLGQMPAATSSTTGRAEP
jgi:RNA polymerase sigma factor (sigma-70 family)